MRDLLRVSLGLGQALQAARMSTAHFYEIQETFSAVALANMRLLELDESQLGLKRRLETERKEPFLGLERPPRAPILHQFPCISRRVNLHGGSVALGHPIACSGARILCTLLHVLQQQGAESGAAAVGNVGGGASCVVLAR